MNLPTNSLELADNLNSHRSTASSYWQFFKNQSLWRTYWWFLVYFSSFLVSSILFSRGPSRPVLWHLFTTWVSISSNVFFFFFFGWSIGPSLVVLVQETEEMWVPSRVGVGSLGWKDLLEKEMAIHSSIFACRILWTESMGSERLDVTEHHTHTQ